MIDTKKEIMKFMYECRDKGIKEVSLADIYRYLRVPDEDIPEESEDDYMQLTDKGIKARLQ